MNLEEQIREMVVSAVHDAMADATRLFIQEVSKQTQIQQASVTYEADQKSVKPRVTVFTGTQDKEMRDLIEYGVTAFKMARDAIGREFTPSPLENGGRSSY